jgi:hypothetical protein
MSEVSKKRGRPATGTSAKAKRLLSVKIDPEDHESLPRNANGKIDPSWVRAAVKEKLARDAERS